MQKAPQERYLPKLQPGSSHSWAKARMQNLDPAARVLDIGPGSGVVGSMLREMGIHNLSAVELDEEARKHVAPIYNRVEENIAEFSGEKFDLILMLDVLEHMTDPFTFLKELRSYVAPGATLLISVPNVAHWSIRLQLLFGIFHYTDRGILDRTHFQFFTRRRVRDLIHAVPEYELRELSSSISPAEFVLPSFLSEGPLFRLFCDSRIFFTRLIPGLAAYQHLAEVRVKSAG